MNIATNSQKNKPSLFLKKRIAAGIILTTLTILFLSSLYYKHDHQRLFILIQEGDAKKFEQEVKEVWNSDACYLNGKPLITFAAESDDSSFLVILLRNKAKVDRKDLQAERTPLFWAIKSGHLNNAQLLIDHGGDLYTRDRWGHPLIRQIIDACPSRIDFFLNQKDFNLNHTDSVGVTPLAVAIHYGNFALVRRLVECDADIHQANHAQVTPLMTACIFGHLEIAKYLLARGAKINAMSKVNKIALDYPLPHQSIYDYLLTQGAKKGKELRSMIVPPEK